MTEETKRTADGWLAQPEYRGVTIMDPDGWDRHPGRFEASWAEEITEDEFCRRMYSSTCLIAPETMRGWAWP